VHKGFRWGNLREKYLLEDLRKFGRIILKKGVQEIAWAKM